MRTTWNTACGLTWMLTVAATLGCGGGSAPPAGKSDKPAAKDSHEHAHGAGPHGGTVADWGGGKFHIEFTVDHDKQQATVYILGSDEKTPAPITAKDGELLLSIKTPAFQVPLKAAPLAGEADGKASKFVGQHESLGKVQEFAGTISAEVDGTPYAGDFDEGAAGHSHGHEHK